MSGRFAPSPHRGGRLLAALLLGGLITLPSCRSGTEGETETVTVYGAASLTGVLERIAASYEEETGADVRIKTGSSGALAKEIVSGAPADVFVSAHLDWVETLREKGLIEAGAAKALAWNKLVVVVPAGADSVPANWTEAMRLDRFVIADPQTSPAGKYARDALLRMARWPAIEPRCVLSYDVRGALALVERDEVAAGVVYLSDARASDRVKVAFRFPEGSYDPVVYVGAVLSGSERPEAARRFLEYLNGPSGRSVFRELGFEGT